MESPFTQFAKSSVVFFFGAAFSKVIVFLLLPLYTHYLPTDAYGFYDLSTTVVALVVALSYGQTWVATMQQMRVAEEGSTQAVCSGAFVFVCSTILYGLILLILHAISPLECFPLIFIFGVADAIQKMAGYIARGYEKNAAFAISGIVQSILIVSLNIFLLAYCSFGVAALFISYIIGSAAQAAYLFAAVRENLRMTSLSWRLVARIAKTSVPLGLNDVSAWLLNSYSRVVVSQVLSMAANGIFAIGFRLSSVMSLGTQCFLYAWQDLSFTNDESRSNPRFFSSAVCQYGQFLLLVGAVLLPFLSLAFPVLVGEAYGGAYQLMPLFLLYAIISAYSVFIGNIFIVINKSGMLFASTALACAFTVVTCGFVTQEYGLQGAILTVCMSFLICIVVRVVILRRKIGFQLHVTKLLPPAIAFSCSNLIFVTGDFIDNVVSSAFFALLLVFSYRSRLAQFFAPLSDRMAKRGRGDRS